MQRDLDRWTRTSPEAVAKGSIAQVIYCIRDARADILEMAATVASKTAALRHAREVIQRERDKAHDEQASLGTWVDGSNVGWRARVTELDAVLAEIDGALNG